MNMKNIFLISIVFHVTLIAVLGPVIRTRMEFDGKKEAQRTEEVREREAERKEQDRLRREKQKLDEKTAQLLKREAELRKKEEIKQEVVKLREKRDEMMVHRTKELAAFRKRSREEVLALEKKAIERMVGEMARHISTADKHVNAHRLVVGAFIDEGQGLSGMADDFTVFDRVLSEEEIAAFQTLPDPPVHRWDFEDGVRDAVSGARGETTGGGELKERGDGAGKAFQGNASYGRADLGRFDLGERMTFSLWVNTKQAKGDQVLFANTGNRDFYSGIRLLVEGRNGEEGALVLSSNGSTAKRVETRTVAGALTCGEWTNVIVTVDKAAGTGAVYVNGLKAELVSAEVDKEAYTGDEEFDKLKELSDEVVKLFNHDTPAPESRDRLDAKLEEVKDLIEGKAGEIRKLDAVRHEIEGAKRKIEEIQEHMDGLEALTDMPKMNDTTAATADRAEVISSDEDTASVAEMYSEATALEMQIAEAKADVDAAREAVSKNSSYEEARENALDGTPQRPDLAPTLGGATPRTIGELNRFREGLNRAGNEMQDMNARADAALGREQSREMSGGSFATRAAMSSAAMQTGGFGELVDMTAFGSGTGEGDSKELREDESGEGAAMTFGKLPSSLKIDEGKIIQAAMPGRRFTRDSDRKGWLYLDTWYVIGPWENKSAVDYSIKHPPEFGIDFDARYHDGKFADRPGHPYQTLKWEFCQSDQVRCQPPAVYGASTYYAYTDVWFEEARDMLIAVASDDASSVWLNGQLIWQDAGQSAWQLGEGYRKVRFRKGFNDILVRIENGPTHCVWSVVLCPPEMLTK